MLDVHGPPFVLKPAPSWKKKLMSVLVIAPTHLAKDGDLHSTPHQTISLALYICLHVNNLEEVLLKKV